MKRMRMNPLARVIIAVLSPLVVGSADVAGAEARIARSATNALPPGFTDGAIAPPVLAQRRVYAMPASGRLQWTLREALNHPFYHWPEMLLGYAVDFSARPVAAEEIGVVDGTGRAVPIQLSQFERRDGLVCKAVIHLMTNLETGQTKIRRSGVVRSDGVEGSSRGSENYYPP